MCKTFLQSPDLCYFFCTNLICVPFFALIWFVLLFLHESDLCYFFCTNLICVTFLHEPDLCYFFCINLMCVTFLHSPDLCYFFGINLIFVTFLHSPDFIIDSAIWEDLKGGHLVEDLRLAGMSKVCQLEIIGLDRIWKWQGCEWKRKYVWKSKF